MKGRGVLPAFFWITRHFERQSCVLSHPAWGHKVYPVAAFHSAELTELLQVHAGEVVEVDLLEGQRRTISLFP